MSMTKVIDFTSQLLKRRKTVKVKVENKREHLLVKIEGVNTTENRAFFSMQHAGDWLNDQGYRWVIGSNGYWSKGGAHV